MQQRFFFRQFAEPDNDNVRRFFLAVALLKKAVDYKAAIKAQVKYILNGTVIVTLLFRLARYCDIEVCVRSDVFVCQCHKTGVLCSKHKYAAGLESRVHVFEEGGNVNNIHDGHI